MRRRAASLLPALLLAACASVPDKPPAPEKKPDSPVHERVHRADLPDQTLEPEDHPFDACRSRETDEIIDEAKRRLQETTCGALLWFDGLFGQGDLKAARATTGRLETSVAHSEFDHETKYRVRFNARAELPALKKSVHAFIGRENEEEFVRDRSEGLGLRAQFPQVQDEDDWLAGLGYALPERNRFKFDFRVGAHGIAHPTVFARARFGYTAYSDATNLTHLRLTPFVDNQVGLGVTTSIDFDHALTPSCLLRWGSIGTISQESSGLDWRSAFIAYQNLLQLRALAGELFLRGATAAAEPLAEYGTRAIYRQPLFEARLFAELIVGYSWIRVDPLVEREGSLGTSFGLELPFGQQ